MSTDDRLADDWRSLPRSQWSAYDRADFAKHKERARARELMYRPLTGEPVIEPLHKLPAGFSLHGKPKPEVSGVDALLDRLGIKGKR